jgi:hypothetical protein
MFGEDVILLISAAFTIYITGAFMQLSCHDVKNACSNAADYGHSIVICQLHARSNFIGDKAIKLHTYQTAQNN